VSTYLDTLASYVPPIVARHFVETPLLLTEPLGERFDAVVFYADISGFTRLAEKLASHGPSGAEELVRLLNAYFSQLIEQISQHGGEVVKFAGDALLAIWPVGRPVKEGAPRPPRLRLVPDGSTTLIPSSLRTATLRAAQCGLSVARQLNNYAVTDDVRLFVRVGIGAGEILAAHVGGLFDRWEFLVMGQPVADTTVAEHLAQSGEVILSPEAWELVRTHCRGERLNDNYYKLTASVVPVTPRPAPPLPPIPTETERALKAYIPAAIVRRLVATQGDVSNDSEVQPHVDRSDWLAELRRVTVLFVQLTGLDFEAPDLLEQMHTVMQALQKALYHYEGSVRQFIVDDKGVVLIAALGLPPLAHEDDAARGAQAALAMQAALRDLGIHTAIGVTTGRAFCGSVGSAQRREYALVGSVVNLAARLMQAAPGDILCDAATYQAAQSHLAFDTLPPITVKGRTDLIPVYRPRGQVVRADLVSDRRSQSLIIGRRRERDLLAEQIQNLFWSGEGGVIVVEGEAGIGKSCLVSEMRRNADNLRLGVLSGAGDAVEKSTPYFAWRPIFNQLYDLNLLTEQSARRQHTLNLLEIEPELERLAPLFNHVLMLDLPDNELTAQMSGQTRGDNTRDVLVQALQASLTRSPKMVIVEDAHWLDSASWALVARIARQLPHLLLVLVTRPIAEPVPAEYRALLQAPELVYVRLDALPSDEAIALTCQRLGVTAVPPVVEALIRDKAEGNPFFIEELTYALRDSGLIMITEGDCRLAPGAGDLRQLHFPDTVQGVITSRIDRLLPAQQMTVKIASVIGRAFPLRLLREIYPIEADRPQLMEHLDTLQQAGLVAQEETDGLYLFKHTITQEVAYNLMLFSQRQQLHRAVAEWYERTYQDDLSAHYATLAHHWRSVVNGGSSDSGPVVKTLNYLEKAGEQALLNGAYREGLSFFRTAYELGQGHDQHLRATERFRPSVLRPISAWQLRRARWERHMGEALLGLGELSESLHHLHKAVGLLGRPVPEMHRARSTLSLWRQVLIQVMHRAWPSVFTGVYREAVRAAVIEREQMAQDILQEVVLTYENLGQTYYFTGETVPAVFTTLRGLNLAEALGPSPELARLYANTGIAASVWPWPALAEAYLQRARATALKVGHRPALAWVFETNGVYHMGLGQLEKAREAFEEAWRLFEQLGDRRRAAECAGLIALTHHYQGHFIRAHQGVSELYPIARRVGDVQTQAWALVGQVASALSFSASSQVETSLKLLKTAQDILADSLDRTNKIRLGGVLARVYLREPDHDIAAQTAEATLQLIEQTRPTSVLSLDGYSGVVETFLRLWEEGVQPSSVPDPKFFALRASRAFSAFAHIFPVAQARAGVWAGLSLWLEGKPMPAQTMWRQSLVVAERLNLFYEQGLLHYELGRHDTGAERQAELARAQAIFKQLDAEWELQRANEIVNRAP